MSGEIQVFMAVAMRIHSSRNLPIFRTPDALLFMVKE
jgi:hypothetical protein